MRAISSLNFLVGFLGFFIYLVLILTFGFKSEKISIYDRNKFNRSRIIQQLIWIAPLLFGFMYLLFTQRAGLDEFLVLIVFPILFLLGGEYFFFQPKLDSLINNGDRLFSTLKQGMHEAKYSFDTKTDKVVLNRDIPEYKLFNGLLVDIRLDRVCKNAYGEYFWVQASAKKAYEPAIKHLDLHAVKNLLRVDRDAYIQEFNEEPYFRSK